MHRSCLGVIIFIAAASKSYKAAEFHVSLYFLDFSISPNDGELMAQYLGGIKASGPLSLPVGPLHLWKRSRF